MSDSWQHVAERLELLASGPLDEQREVASVLGIELGQTPAPVAAEIIKANLARVLMTKVTDGFELPETFWELEEQVESPQRAVLQVGSRAGISAWFEARYMLLTVQGLRGLEPCVGDIVSRFDAPDEHMVVSSIGEKGVIYMKGGLGKRSWPNYLEMVARNDGSDRYKELVAVVDSKSRNARLKHPASSPRLDLLEQYKVPSRHPSSEALRELEDLLESGEKYEAPFQKLIERNPEMLASLVHGNWGTYVLPQRRLGAEHVTDFLVLGVSSVGPEWLAVELEAPRHELLNTKGTLRAPVQHAVTQIQDWRDWLTANVAYAQDQLHLYGLTNSVPGLVIIGRSDPAVEREPARSRIAADQRIHIHSWDWLLRDAQQVVEVGHQGATLVYT
ncbi:Shedu anti-phage system protein SduA domain-containing protein [Promicromonospora kroppenstedtii]|uniref:Shedu anti-phage system protein SduA domain-containing protein n=1 Tax=Promicromonospora kroppenstedtii TaxID=440482 RepID=A0ABW7XQW6_9MICO